jgi:hypothetical protein
MTTKADFNAEEWDLIASAPAIAGLLVIAAQRGGTIRESFAMAKVYAEAKQEHRDSGLLEEIASKAPQLERGEFKSKQELEAKGVDRIREATALLEGKASADEVEAYRSFVLKIAERAAEADKSGGVLGIGGERVSDAEGQALDRVAAALGTSRTDPG